MEPQNANRKARRTRAAAPVPTKQNSNRTIAHAAVNPIFFPNGNLIRSLPTPLSMMATNHAAAIHRARDRARGCSPDWVEGRA